MATHSSIFAWKIPWTEEPSGLQSMGSQSVGHDWATSLEGQNQIWLLELSPSPPQTLRPTTSSHWPHSPSIVWPTTHIPAPLRSHPIWGFPHFPWSPPPTAVYSNFFDGIDPIVKKSLPLDCWFCGDWWGFLASECSQLLTWSSKSSNKAAQRVYGVSVIESSVSVHRCQIKSEF